MSGLFVYKHAEAVRAQVCDVRVIHSQAWRDTWRQWKALQREGWKPDVVQLNVIQKQGLLTLWLKHRYNIPYVDKGSSFFIALPCEMIDFERKIVI